MLRTTLFVVALATAAPGLAAQETAPSPSAARAEPAADALAAARDLLHAVNFDAQMESTARQSSEATFNTVLRQLEERLQMDVPAELESQLREVTREQMEQLIAEMRVSALEQAARVYARYFTADEIRELQRLQTNPVMVKMQRIGPQLVTELSQIGVAAAAQHMPELMAGIDAAVAAWQRSHPQAPRPAPVS